MVNMAKNIAAHPEVFVPGYVEVKAFQAISNAVKDPKGTMGKILQGFEAFRNLDPAAVGGRSIPGAVLMGIVGPGSPLAGKIGTAQKAFETTAAAAPIPNYTGMSPTLSPPLPLLPPGQKPLIAVINEIRWAGPLAGLRKIVVFWGESIFFETGFFVPLDDVCVGV
jgi:hypothetical protein